jgi:hypothetical protein
MINQKIILIMAKTMMMRNKTKHVDNNQSLDNTCKDILFPGIARKRKNIKIFVIRN